MHGFSPCCLIIMKNVCHMVDYLYSRVQRRIMITSDRNPEHGNQRQNGNEKRHMAHPGRNTAAWLEVLFFDIQFAVDRKLIENDGGNNKHQRPPCLCRVRTNHCRQAVNGSHQPDKRIEGISGCVTFYLCREFLWQRMNRYKAAAS